MVVCVHIPRFALTVAAGGPQALAGRALALAPMAGAELCVGEVSGVAEAYGVGAGMALGEALARCPELELVAADPLAVAEAWEEVLCSLESIGATVESAREGLAYFEASGLRGMHGSDAHTIALARRALGRPAKIGMGPTRFCALAAALEASARRAKVIDAGGAHRYLAARPVELLGFREQTAALVEPLKRLGVHTLGELRELAPARSGRAAVSSGHDVVCSGYDATCSGYDATCSGYDATCSGYDATCSGYDATCSVSRGALADRFGESGILAHRLASGEDGPLVPRGVEETLEECMDVGDAGSGEMLRRVLGVLVDRLLARPERRSRTLRAVVLSARLVGGGTWRERVVFRQALSDARRVGLALSLRLPLLPAPAESLRLGVERFGPVAGEQHTLLEQSSRARRERLEEAVKQMRTVAGAGAALRAVCIDPDSRVPERRVVLTPMPG
jgi:protein ImuB